MLQSLNAAALRQQGYALKAPFGLKLAHQGTGRALQCQRILRHLPGKRLVVDALWRHQTRVIAKIYLDPSKAERHFHRELRGHEALVAAEISTPDLLDRTSLDDGHTPVLLFRNMTDHENLEAHLSSLSRDADRLRALQSVVALIADLHAGGLIQRDIHPGNFLFANGSVMMIDGADIRSLGPEPLSKPKSLKNLALFFAQFSSDENRILEPLRISYANRRGWVMDRGDTRRFHRKVKAWRKWRLRKYLQKTQRNCTSFAVRRTKHRLTVYDRAWFSDKDQDILTSPDDYIESGRLLKDGNSTTVAQIFGDDHSLVIKRYNIKNRWHALKRCLRPSRAMRSWENAHMLRFMGLATPKPLAVIEERRLFLRSRAYLTMAHLPGPTLDQVIASGGFDGDGGDRYLQEIGAMLQCFADEKLSHGDLKATNFLISSGNVYLIDLDAMKRYRSSAGFQRAFSRDLQRLQDNWAGNTPVLERFQAMIGGIERRSTDQA